LGANATKFKLEAKVSVFYYFFNHSFSFALILVNIYVFVKYIYIYNEVIKDEEDKIKNSKERKSKETEWMLKLRTGYPYGLNRKIGDQYQHFPDLPVGINFPSLKRNSKHPSRNRTITFRNSNSISSFFNLFKNAFSKSFFGYEFWKFSYFIF